MIPATIDIGGAWDVLPPGLHEASLAEVRESFATDPHRLLLYRGLVRGCDSLRTAGCTVVYLDGSYATAKPRPGDFDVCWEPSGVDLGRLDPVLLDFRYMRLNQKRKYGGEFFPSTALADRTRTFVDYFRVEKVTGLEKGLILIRL